MSAGTADVMVTGVGLVTAAGSTRETTWARLCAGECAIGDVAAWDASAYPVRLAGEARGFAPGLGERRMDRCHQLLLAAAREALDDAAWNGHAPQPARVAVVLGSSLGGTLSGQTYLRARLRGSRGPGRRLHAYPLGACLDLITRVFGFRGPRTVLSTACTASTVAVAYALELLRSGRADAVLCGGVDPLAELSFAGFSSMGNVAPGPCSPFSHPVGLTVGEGAGMLVLEPAARVGSRGGRPRARLMGYGLSADASHLTSPDPAGHAQAGAAQAALRMAGVAPRDVGYVNAHGTGTAGNDVVESRSIRLVLGEHAGRVPVSSLKGALGHTLGAAGAVEAAVTVLAVERGTLPPTAGFAGARAGCTLDHVAGAARVRPVETALSLNFAFGGNNAAVVVGRAAGAPPPPPPPARRVVVTALGVLTPLACSPGELIDALAGGDTAIGPVRRFAAGGPGASVAAQLADFDPARFTRASTRRMDRVGCLTLCAAEQALAACGVRVTSANQARIGIVAGTVHGPVASCARFYGAVASGGRGDPSVFPNTVMNAGAGHASIHLRLKGCNVALSSGQTSGLSAVCMAYDLVRSGAADVMLAGGADELEAVELEAYAAARRVAPFARARGEERCAPFAVGAAGMILGEGAVFLVLEALDTALARGARILGEVAGWHANADVPVVRGSDPDGAGVAECMAGALADARVRPAEVDWVGAGALSHPLHDTAEARGLARIFGRRPVPVAALSSRVGASAATAPLAACAALLGMEGGWIPGGALGEAPDPRHGVALVQGPARPGRLDVALVNAVSLGGGNASLVLRRWASTPMAEAAHG
jgi:3-oxoacyl-[acyl-carrier-protein] synthase II